MNKKLIALTELAVIIGQSAFLVTFPKVSAWIIITFLLVAVFLALWLNSRFFNMKIEHIIDFDRIVQNFNRKRSKRNP